MARAEDSVLAVLTGDLVASSRLEAGQLNKVTAAIADAVAAFGRLHPGSIIGAPDFYRGDSWQVALAMPRLSLRLAVLLRAAVISRGKTDTRVAIGIGGGNTVSKTRISQSVGNAFLRSGRALDDIGSRRLALGMPDAPPDTGRLVSSVVTLLDHVIAGWTAKQAEAVRLVLENPGKADIDLVGANASDSGRRNFTKLRNRANTELVMETLVVFEDLELWGEVA